MIDINDPRLNEDKNANTLLVYRLIEAAAEDHVASKVTRGKYSRRAYERMLNEAFPTMQNKTAFQTAGRYYNVNFGGSKGNASTLGGPDLWRFVSFFLRNLSGYGWHKFKKTLAEAGPPYSELLDLEVGNWHSPEREYELLAVQQVGDIVGPEIDPGTKLREIANQFDQLQTKLRLSNTNYRLATQELVTIRRQINALVTAFDRISQAYLRASSVEQDKLKDDMTNLQQMLHNLRSLV